MVSWDPREEKKKLKKFASPLEISVYVPVPFLIPISFAST